LVLVGRVDCDHVGPVFFDRFDPEHPEPVSDRFDPEPVSDHFDTEPVSGRVDSDHFDPVSDRAQPGVPCRLRSPRSDDWSWQIFHC
jgi:hypothetical protein